MRMTDTVKQLLIINIIFFIGSQFVAMAYPLFSMYYPENPNFRVWQIITHMFMHDKMPNLMHIVFNMFALVSFGSVLEQFWGAKKFIFFYISCGLGAVLIHQGVNYYYFHKGLNLLIENGENQVEVYKILAQGKINSNWQNLIPLDDFNYFASSYFSNVVGASGAIYGLLVAFAFMFPNAELALMFIPVPIKAKYFVPIFMILYDGLFGIFGSSIGVGSNVAHVAHIGGALTGFIMMWYWKKNQFNKNRWD
jgi:membrane associated rhomboid family serine protease